jgi:ATP-dependent DNA ligase
LGHYLPPRKLDGVAGAPLVLAVFRPPRVANRPDAKPDSGALPVANALIDGEAVTFRPDGHSDFAALRTKEGGERASFVAFDLLDLEGDDLRDRPLEERREALARLVHGADGIRFSEALSADGVLVFAHACKLGREGIVCPSASAAAIAAGRVGTGSSA